MCGPLHIDTPRSTVRDLWTVPRSATVPANHFSFFLLLVCWMLWKHPNGIVFSGESPSHRRFWHSGKEETHLWCCRLPVADRQVTEEAWCLLFSSMQTLGKIVNVFTYCSNFTLYEVSLQKTLEMQGNQVCACVVLSAH
jgi:hypothetical protein